MYAESKLSLLTKFQIWIKKKKIHFLLCKLFNYYIIEAKIAPQTGFKVNQMCKSTQKHIAHWTQKKQQYKIPSAHTSLINLEKPININMYVSIITVTESAQHTNTPAAFCSCSLAPANKHTHTSHRLVSDIGRRWWPWHGSSFARDEKQHSITSHHTHYSVCAAARFCVCVCALYTAQHTSTIV